MRTRIGLGFAALFLATAACSNSVFVSPEAGAGEDGGVVPVTGGGDSDAGDSGVVDATPPPNCDTSKLPADDVCVVNDAEGIFVSSSMGSASGNGSKESPVASLDAAIAKAKQSNRRVYACAETYAETVHFVDGVSVFGYFDCNSAWAVVPSKRAKVASPTSPAATATNITTPTRVEAVDLVAPDFTTGSQSSIALVATGSPALTFKGATIHAGTGGAGANGSDAIQLTDSGSAKNGAAARPSFICTSVICYTVSSAGGTNACSGATGHDGGPGGSGGSPGTYRASSFGGGVWDALTATTLGNPTIPTAQTAQGGTWGSTGSAGAAGTDGSNGNAGADFGTLSASGYLAADGTAATDGTPGQGGGGSGGYNDLNTRYPPGTYVGNNNAMGVGAAGAGGGAGGCPGLAATAGKGGGASIAIVAIGSAFTLDTVTIETSNGGAGGAAGSASKPTSGGVGGTYAYDVAGGASGGSGGHAGAAGNGGGGPSIGIAWQGNQPTRLASNITVGAGGSGVAARTGNDGRTIPASASGVSVDTYSF